MNGDVRIRIESWMPEKLLQRALDMGIAFSSVERPEARALVVETSEADARRLLELCRRFSIPATVLRRRGRSALGRYIRRRWTLAAGIAAALALCWLALGHIWLIDVRFTGEAAGQGDNAAFDSALRALGVRPGITGRVDTSRLASELLAAMGGYSFVGVRVEGVRLLVEAAPEVPAPEIYDVSASRDLYADRNGIVVSVNVEAGAACVKPGDTVARGQLLIRGEEQAAADETRGIGALGEVVIRTWFEGVAEGSLVESQVSYTGRQAVAARLSTPWFSAPLVRGEAFDRQVTNTEIIPIGGLYLPVCVVRDTMRETRLVRERGDRELLSTRLSALAMADARAALSGMAPDTFQIARSWLRYSQPDPYALRARAVYEIYTNTAAAREAIPKGG